MLKINLPSAVLLALAFSHVGYSAENPAPAKSAADLQTTSNQFWWPERLDLAPLRQHAAESSPLDKKIRLRSRV